MAKDQTCMKLQTAFWFVVTASNLKTTMFGYTMGLVFISVRSWVFGPKILSMKVMFIYVLREDNFHFVVVKSCGV